MGPAAAIPRIPKLLYAMLRTAAHINASRPDLVVLVGLRRFQPALGRHAAPHRVRRCDPRPFSARAWLDDARKARRVSRLCIPVTAFAHQWTLSQPGLPHRVFRSSAGGALRLAGAAAGASAPGRHGRMLPGSRGGELRRHVPRLLDAFAALRRRRPALRGRFAAADARAERIIAESMRQRSFAGIDIERGVERALQNADGAWVASGTAVLETALVGVPAVALYVIPPALERYGKRMIKHRYITLPNLVLGREIVPELLQDAASPEALADTLDRLMLDPSEQLRAFEEMRAALGPSDALDRCARFAVSLAGDGV